MLKGISYLHAKFQINILRNKKVIKLLELWTLWLKRKKKKKKKENSEYKRVVITTLKKENSEYKRFVFTTLKTIGSLFHKKLWSGTPPNALLPPVPHKIHHNIIF